MGNQSKIKLPPKDASLPKKELQGSEFKKLKKDPIMQHHFRNIALGKTKTDERGNLNTVRTIQVDNPKLNKGKPTLIPTVYNGRVVSQEEAIEKAIKSKIKYPSRNTHAQLRYYDQRLHTYMNDITTKEQARSFMRSR